MALNSRNIITLLSLPRCGKVTTFKIAEFAAHNQIEVINIEDTKSLIEQCKQKKIVSSLPEYNITEIQYSLDKADAIIEKSIQAGIGMTNFFESTFPDNLKNILDFNGKNVSPILIYYKGDISKAKLPSVAIIGTREPTDEGRTAGEYFGKLFAENGFNIVSGLAVGCDTAGHKGAILANGITTAFLAHGLDKIYPKENTGLASSIIESGGILISEYSIGSDLSRFTLVERDRLQAGLALATIVIQTGINGGTMHAANATLVNRKPLFVVEYKSSEVMNHNKVQGNTLLLTKGASVINANNAHSIMTSLINEKRTSNNQLNLFENK